MGKRSSKKREHDFSVTAFRVVQEATGQSEVETKETTPESSVDKHAAAVALGRLGGLKGGKARADKLTPKERQESARNAAKARWKKG
ncbi:MAG: hypothetical protein NTV59_08210 [Chloroflexi bacterium]|nr:hypothetical protein [Chloroflexota bacterium]